MAIGQPEFVSNPEPRCPVVLVLDTSASMNGAPMEALNQAVGVFKQQVAADAQASLRVEVAIITCGGQARLAQDFVTIAEFTPPTLQAGGDTPLGAAIDLALNELDRRKASYKANGIFYYRPWVWVITDGAPTDTEKFQAAAKRVLAGESAKAFSFFAVGVEGANLDILKQAAPPNRPPVALKGLDFREMFLWLSASMKKASTSKPGEQVALPPVDGWATVTS